MNPLNPEELRALEEFYRQTMHPRDLDDANGRFIVRHWDGMDGEWMDVTEPVGLAEALVVWFENTQGGERNTSYDDIDYYCIFPADTRMIYSGGNEMCRKPGS